MEILTIIIALTAACFLFKNQACACDMDSGAGVFVGSETGAQMLFRTFSVAKHTQDKAKGEAGGKYAEQNHDCCVAADHPVVNPNRGG